MKNLAQVSQQRQQTPNAFSPTSSYEFPCKGSEAFHSAFNTNLVVRKMLSVKALASISGFQNPIVRTAQPLRESQYDAAYQNPGYTVSGSYRKENYILSLLAQVEKCMRPVSVSILAASFQRSACVRNSSIRAAPLSCSVQILRAHEGIEPLSTMA